MSGNAGRSPSGRVNPNKFRGDIPETLQPTASPDFIVDAQAAAIMARPPALPHPTILRP